MIGGEVHNPQEKQCRAHSKRSNRRCRNWALRGKNVCRFHGGKSKGPKTQEGRDKIKSLHYIHGGYSKKTREEKKKIRGLLRQSCQLLANFK